MFSHQRSVHAILGGGKVADVLLWRNRSVSAALFVAMTTIWFLIEIVGYNLVTFVCDISITTMLSIFIWHTGSDIFKWNPPKIPEIMLHDSAFRKAASIFHARFNQLLSKFLDIASGRDLALFFLALISLYIMSVIGTYFSFLNLFFLSFFCMETLPFLYERYEEEVDHIGGRVSQQMKKMYTRFDSKVLNKIPRGPLKEKKLR